MRKIFFYSILVSLTLWACSSADETPVADVPDVDTFVPQVYPETGNFYTTNSDEQLLVAHPIIYDVIVDNPDPSDEWTNFCLKDYDNEALENVLFNAVYQKKLVPYHYHLDTVLSMEYVKDFEKKIAERPLGKIQFQEKWFFDETNMKMYKQVLYIVMGYELVNDEGEIYGYEPAFKVYLDDAHNQITK